MLDCATKEVFCERTVPLPVIEKLIDAAHEQGIYFQTYTGEFVLTEQDDENLKHYPVSYTHLDVYKRQEHTC